MLPVPLWTVLAAIGALLLGVGGLRFARARKARTAAAAAAGAGAGAVAAAPALAEGESMIDQYARTELPGDEEEAVTEMPAEKADTGTLVDDEDRTAVAPTAAPATAGEDDPLAEVNVYLAYERFDQAEQLVRDAISRFPDRPDYQLKLLEVFYAAKNVTGFESAARDLQDAVGDDHEMMQQARAWWSDLGTGRELFADAGAPAAEAADDELFDVTAAEAGDQTGVDFDLGFQGDEATGTASAGSGVDFDLSEATGETGEDTGLDFDLGGLDEALATGDEGDDTGLDLDLAASDEKAEQGGETGLDFDLAGLDEAGEPAEDAGGVPERVGGGTEDSELDFDLAGLDEAGGAPAEAEGASDDSALDFSLDDTVQRGAGTEPDAQRDEAGEDSGLDFDLGDTAQAGTDTKPEAERDEAVEDSGLDFDLGDTTTYGEGAEGAPVAEPADEDVGTHLDLGETLETRPAAPTPTPVEERADDESVLDFDLGDTESRSRGEKERSELDFDLGDTGTEEVAAGTAEADEDSVLDLDLGDTAEGTPVEEQPLSLDMELPEDAGAGDEKPGGPVLDSGEDEGEQAQRAPGTGLDLELDDGTTTGPADDEAGFPTLDVDQIDDAKQERPSFDTVQLSPGEADAMREDEFGGEDEFTDGDSGADSQFGVDTEFRDIFAGGAGEGSASGGTSSVDFDLGTDLGGDEPAEPAGDVAEDLESTQFMLRDLPVPGDGGDAGGEDEDDHTLALGRGPSGEVDEMQTKLDLAQAYMDMGDSEGARNLLGEVMAEGDDAQKAQAREMLGKLA